FETIATTAYRASIELAKEKGSFPFLIGDTDEETRELREAFIITGYMQQMPVDIKGGIVRYGIRNCYLLTVAPTGSTGTMVRVSTVVEPVISLSDYRSGRLDKVIEVKADTLQEYLQEHPVQDEAHVPDWFHTVIALQP